MTLETKQGNAFDTASLLIALLRASGIHARYAYGTVRIPIEQAMNWVGGVTKPEAAIQLLAQGGIPVTGVVQAGQIAWVKLEHIWVEAWIDFFPSRGAKHKAGDSWIPLDASFKQYDFRPKVNLLEKVPFDVSEFGQHLLQNIQADATANWVTGVDQAYIDQALSEHQQRLKAYIEANSAVAEGILEQRAIIPAQRPVFAAGLPYQLVAKGNTFALIPNHFQHSITVKFYHSEMAQYLDNPNLSYTINLSTLNSCRLSISYEPATSIDAQTLETLQTSPRDSLPTYLVNVVPVLKLDGIMLATGTAIGMGQPQYYTLIFKDPHYVYSEKGLATAGDEIAFVVDAQGLTPEFVQKRLDHVSDSAAENMHQAGLHFWMQHDQFDNFAAQVYGVHRQRAPSVGAFSLPLSVRYFFGIPQAGQYKSRQVDVKRNAQAVVGGNEQTRLAFVTQIGTQGSYLEGAVLDQLFGRQRESAFSATQLLAKASQQNIPIYTVTAANVQMVLPKLQVSAEVKEDIANAVQVGKQVIVPQQELVHGHWIGVGYIVRDPVTGEGAYMLDGGLNGGGQEICEIGLTHTVFPLSGNAQLVNQVVSDAFSTFLMTYLELIEAMVNETIDNVTYMEKLQLAVLVLANTVADMATAEMKGEGCYVIIINKIISDGYITVLERHTGDYYTSLLKEKESFTFATQGFGRKCQDYQWNFGDGSNTSSEPNPEHIYAQPGDYPVKVTANCLSPGSQQLQPVSCEMKVYLLRLALIPNYDRDDTIDEADRTKTEQGETFNFWVNDDDDYGFEGGSDILKSSSLNINGEDKVINGVRDLVDFFPVWIDLQETLNILSPTEYQFTLLHDEAAVNALVDTDLTPLQADYHLFNGQFAEAIGQSSVVNIGSPSFTRSYFVDGVIQSENVPGYSLPEGFLGKIQAGNKGVILLEGRTASSQPLVLQIGKKGSAKILYEQSMPLLLVNVEKMYHHLNLRGPDIPDPYPYKTYPNGTAADKNLIFVHGFNVKEEAGRGWHAEMFKRFYWAGSKAKFYGVSWHGDEGIPNYQGNVANAFGTASFFKRSLEGIAHKTIVAHSLGNMMVSWAIAEQGLEVENYFMVNAAIPLEAIDVEGNYTLEPSTDPMVHPEWRDYPQETWAANWYKLFDTNDVRSKLTWRGLFNDPRLVSTMTRNFYSSGDEIFEIYGGNDLGVLTGATGDPARYSWQKQEVFKGRENQEGIITVGQTNWGGWGFHSMDTDEFYTVDEAGEVVANNLAVLRTNPVFRHDPVEIFATGGVLAGFPPHPYTQDHLLAKAIPALSFAVGNSKILGGDFSKKNTNLDLEMKADGWPRNHGEYEQRWLHSDLRNMAYLYTYPLFKKIVEDGGLK